MRKQSSRVVVTWNGTNDVLSKDFYDGIARSAAMKIVLGEVQNQRIDIYWSLIS